MTRPPSYRAPDEHYVDEATLNEATLPSDHFVEEEVSTRRLVWRKFRRHRLGLISGIFIVTLYLMLPFMNFIAPYGAAERLDDFIYAPPTPIHFFHEGEFIGPFVYAMEGAPDLETLSWVYEVDRSEPYPIEFFCTGSETYFLAMIPTTFRVFCSSDEWAPIMLLGADRLGRDVFSRILYGAQISLTVGLIGITISFVIGIVLGGLAGYFGGIVDSIVQRMIEVLRSLPELPLWLALSAAIPSNWHPLTVFFGISIILGLLDWPGLARSVRSKFLALREEDFVQAAELVGAKPRRIIRVHMLPNFMSHLIASAALSIPTMILGETALSFLGLGLRPPVVSWGVMLNDAQNLAAIEIYPWISTPILPIILVVLAFNFLGDGLRDSLDPYS